MNLTNDQVQAVKGGEAVPVLPAEVGEECVLVRKDVYQRITHLPDGSELNPARLYSMVGHIMAEDDANDPSLESYQKYKR